MSELCIERRNFLATSAGAVAAAAAGSLPLWSTAAGSKPKDVEYKPMVPRWHLPPIASPYFIGWHGTPTPSRPGFDTALPLRTQTLEEAAPRADLPWWYGRGIMGCAWYAGTQVDWLSTVDDYVAQFMKAIENGEVGVCLDEWVDFDSESQDLQDPPGKSTPGNPKNRRLAEACRIIKQRYPQLFIGVYSHMQSDSMIEAMKAGWIDLNVIMSYMHWPGEPAWTERLALRRLNNAKKAGVMEKSIPCISLAGAPNEVITLEWIERWVQYYREHFAQMPGVCFYPHPFRGGKAAELSPEQHRLIRHCDQLAENYYIDPAPKVSILAPADGQIVEGPVEVKAQAEKAVAQWRLYVDAEQVAESETGEFRINRLPPGSHVLTVHAITADWLRGAGQIQVSAVQSPNEASEAR